MIHAVEVKQMLVSQQTKTSQCFTYYLVLKIIRFPEGWCFRMTIPLNIALK